MPVYTACIQGTQYTSQVPAPPAPQSTPQTLRASSSGSRYFAASHFCALVFGSWRVEERNLAGFCVTIRSYEKNHDWTFWFFFPVLWVHLPFFCYFLATLALPETDDNGNAMLPKRVKISKTPTIRFLYRSLWAQIFPKKKSKLSKKPEKHNSWADLGPRSAWEELSRMFNS